MLELGSAQPLWTPPVPPVVGVSGFENMLTEVVAGSTINSVVYFLLPVDIDTTGATAAYALVDAESTVWTLGLADILEVEPISLTENKIKASSIVCIPETIAVDLKGTKYQIRWLMLLEDGSRHSSSEFITILPKISGEAGVLDAVDLQTATVTLQAVLPTTGSANLEIFCNNTPVYSQANIVSTSSSHAGYDFEHNLALSTFPAQLAPYTLVWSYGTPLTREIGRLYVITPSIMGALRDLSTYLNRLNRKARLDELTFTTPDLLTFLSAGADMFNATDHYTTFNFTNAQQAFKQYWLVCSQIIALRTRYLEEGESSFDFSGQAVTLTVDITSYIESQISSLEAWRDANLPGFKRQLHKRGILDGDASSLSYVARTRGVAGLTDNPLSNLYSVHRTNRMR